jgi:hypothetical protein
LAVQRGDGTGMFRIQGVQQIESFGPADFADNKTVGPVTKRGLHELSNRDLCTVISPAGFFIWPRFEAKNTLG